MPGIPAQVMQLFAQMSGGDMGGMGHDHAKMLREQAKTKRDFVSENSPKKESGGGMDALMGLFANMSEGESRRISVSGGEGGDENQTTGVYPWPELAPSMGQVPSVMPQAEAMGGLNEQLIMDYMDAMNVYNEGGKGEKIASWIGGLAGAGGYIADRTSGDIDRRRQSGPDLDYALQNLFSIPQGMRAKRQGQMTQAMSSADMRHKLRTGTVGGVESALTEDDRKSLAWRTLAQQSDLGRRRVAASGSQKAELLKDKQWKIANKVFEEEFAPFYDTETEALAAMKAKKEHQFNKLMSIWNFDWEDAGDTYTGMRDKAEDRWWKRHQKEWDNAEGDDEKRKAMMDDLNRSVATDVGNTLRHHGEGDVDVYELLGIDEAGPGDEITEGGDERDWLDKIGGGIGGFLGIGTERGGAQGAYEGWMGAPPDEDVAGALDSITGGGNVGQNVEQIEGGFIVTNPDGSTSFIPDKQKKKPPTGVDLSGMMEYISSLAGGK